MSTKMGILLGEIRINIKHAAIVMTHAAQTIISHYIGDFSCLYPLGYFIPALWVTVQYAGNLMELNADSVKHVGYLRHRAGRTKGKPFAGHLGTVGHSIERGVINSRLGRQV